jgi:hypothetical protein
MPTAKSEFRNTRDFHIGVVLKREDGRSMKGHALEPHGRVWMDEEEQMATANAPRQESDNPFVNGDLELVQSAQVLANRRPIGDTEHPNLQATGGQIADENPEPPSEAPAPEPATEPEAAGAKSDGEEGSASEESSEEPKPPPAERKGPTGRSVKEEEESARNAAARRRPTAPGDPSHTGSAPVPAGEPPQGQRAPAEEVATPGAVPTE